MPGRDWIALGRFGGGFRAAAMRGAALAAQGVADTEAAALDPLGMPDATIVRLGEGAPDTAPCAALPENGPPAVLTQDRPADILGVWPRLMVAGFVASRPNWDGVLCLSEGGTHHWVHVSAREVISFQGFLTPRLIALLGGAARPDPEALAASQSHPDRLAAHLRQAALAGDPAATTGHLIGAELAASRPYWLGQQVVLISENPGKTPYAAALTQQGVPVESAPEDDLVQAGLTALAHSLGDARD